MKAMNVTYASKELFLVAPNIPNDPTFVDMYADSYTADNNLQSSLYTNAYTKTDAEAQCVKLGATLATKAQLLSATSLDATWCLAGWISDSTDLFAPIQTTCPYTKRNTDEGGSEFLRKFRSGATNKGYPICWGTKPAEPAVNVREFNKTAYNMISTSLLTLVMNGGTSDLYPASFTEDEARYALEQRNYNIGAIPPANPAREYLIANVAGSLNNPGNQIYQTDPDHSEDVTNKPLEACSILGNTRTNFHNKFEQLRAVFRDVSGAVISMLGAKNENATFSAKLQDICAQETPQSSPACAKLATLDFSLLYNTTAPDKNLLDIAGGTGGPSNQWKIADTSTSRLAALEALNIFKLTREGELCEAYSRILTIETYIGCSASSSGSGIIQECSYRTVGSDLPPTLVMDRLDVNSSEFLKLRLKEISPYFATSNYVQLVSGILSKLSLTLRVPSLNDFQTSTGNFKDVRTRIDAIKGYFRSSLG